MEKSLNIAGWKFKITLQQDRAILLICIGIALLFWIFTKLSKTYVTEKKIAIEYQLSPRLAFVEPPVTSVNIYLSGRGWELLAHSLFSKKTPIVLELTDTTTTYVPRAKMLEKIGQAVNLQKLKIESVDNENLPVRLESLAAKKVPVIFAPVLQFAPGYNLKSAIILRPDSVEIAGALSLIEKINSWSADSVIFSNIKSSLTKTVKLSAPANPELKLHPDKVEAEIPVEFFTEKTLFVPVKILNPPADSVSVFPRQIQLRFAIGDSHFNEVSGESFEVVVDLKNARPGASFNSLPVSVSRQPDYIKALNFTPKSVEYFIIREN